jgi:LacI family transcriptional regulator
MKYKNSRLFFYGKCIFLRKGIKYYLFFLFLRKISTMKKGTLDDIAKRTGYSKTTISRVLNGKAAEYRISEVAQNNILCVVKELNYKPNLVAQSLRNQSTHTIGLVLPHIDNPFFANIASTIITEAQKFDYTVMVIDTLEKPDLEEQAIGSMMERKIDGIILVPCGDNPSQLEEVSVNMPLVLVDRYFENHHLPYVSTDNYTGAYQATKLLLESGHRRILCIQGPQISVTTQKRVKGCMDAVRDMGDVELLTVRGNDFSIQNGYVETKMAITQPVPPTAIFALSNTILLGAIQALNEQKMRVPEDISLVSFDDNLYLDYLNPPVTRIAQPLSNIGIIAVKMLVQQIAEKTNPQTSILLQPRIVKRESVRVLSEKQ